ncbi:adenosylmethionine--8-amino-7-oxononanoate transaminase [Nocardiopsis lambiniae]|uniref:Adenosylmethionine-8-amino-7-oxononanoate aminotransferase n=1 Tax=Nocardiopsis lambiniae TaxID=3075539 RepID=A0ABU2M4D8_9ACTN|nr:adenosylmethionine--8-amino-7-oxononanoate transaminase [Nocardiopsis sp. DSM 44743]MDT0327513.1 adenosylmethionine--8-amino-7-oxononanoate transaminase [Nocardiopsis sp. DSM 44743]
MTPEWIRSVDRAHLWHPYSTLPAGEPPLVVTGAGGSRLHLSDGERGFDVVDGMSSWWSAIHGYRHPVLDAALHAQADTFSHVMFGGLTHGPAAELAALLVEITPEPLRHVFLADSGSVAVEVAMKMCLQYHRSRGEAGRSRFLTWRGGYHGDTFHAMSVCDPEGGMHALWGDVLPAQIFAPAPPEEYDPDHTAALESLVARHARELAGIIVEPLVQGAGGMRFHDPRHLRELRRIADEYGVLLVFDEIATGFGRTGSLFAADAAGTAPDIMCLGKALTGGYLTLAAVLCGERVTDGIARGEVPVLAHGPTFMANPLACAVAVASVRLLMESDWRSDIARIERGLTEGLAGVPGTRVRGAIGVIELDGPVRMREATRAALDAGVWLRPFRNLVYTMPPYVCTDDDIATVAAGMVAAAEASR